MTMMMMPIMTKVVAERTWKDLRVFLFGVFATQVTNRVPLANSTNLVTVANMAKLKYGTFQTTDPPFGTIPNPTPLVEYLSSPYIQSYCGRL